MSDGYDEVQAGGGKEGSTGPNPVSSEQAPTSASPAPAAGVTPRLLTAEDVREAHHASRERGQTWYRLSDAHSQHMADALNARLDAAHGRP